MVNPLFQFHKLNEDGIKRAEVLAEAFTTCLDTVEAICPAGRELSIVRTKLEEASFFAKKGMAVNVVNQV